MTKLEWEFTMFGMAAGCNPEWLADGLESCIPDQQKLEDARAKIIRTVMENYERVNKRKEPRPYKKLPKARKMKLRLTAACPCGSGLKYCQCHYRGIRWVSRLVKRHNVNMRKRASQLRQQFVEHKARFDAMPFWKRWSYQLAWWVKRKGTQLNRKLEKLPFMAWKKEVKVS